VIRAARVPSIIVSGFVLAAVLFSTLTAGAQQSLSEATRARLLAERLGKDDGFALTILASADLVGSLEMCG
jgi:hypothetical protein